MRWMTRAMTGLVSAGLTACAWSQPAEWSEDPLARQLEERLAADVLPIIDEFCIRCHGSETSKGGVRFDGVASIDEILLTAWEWETAREMLEFGDMPPDDEPAPTDLQALLVQQWIDDALAYYPPDGRVDPGWFTIHRLNRAEYRNTLRDLLGVDPEKIDLAADLPPDDTGYGFDNIADVLSMSALQMELYLDAAERAVEVGLGPLVEISAEPRPVGGLESPRNSRPLGSGFALYSNGDVFGWAEVPVAGEYEIVIEAWGQRGGDELPRLSLRVDDREVGEAFIEAQRGETQEARARVRLEPGRHKIAGAFTNDFYIPDQADRNLAIESVSLAGPLGEISRPGAYEQVFFVTPGEGANDAAERSVAQRVVRRFAERAFRRPLREDESRRLMQLYEQSRSAGDGFERAVRTTITATLISPHFLYRSVANRRSDDPDQVYELNDHELATRLSYFLWSTMPDEELTDLATRGRLKDESVLREQARRMLTDPRADAFVDNFTGQWLLLRNLDGLAIDQATFPEYSSALRNDMVTEAKLFFRDIVRGERSVLDCLDSDSTYLNERLASYYGFEGVTGEQFRRVGLADDSPRGGVLTMGAVLTVTSNPTRTSPVKRGLYVLDQLLGSPPPPPPPDIPRLEQSASQAELSEHAPLRQQLAAHLTDPTCVTCHRRMDPIGLAMENFDAIGRWRDAYDDAPIDASGELPGGVAFDGPVQLKEILLAREDDFVENLSRQVLTYALGRGLEPFDRPTVRGITDEVRARDDSFGALVEAVVSSAAFRSCRGRSVDDE